MVFSLQELQTYFSVTKTVTQNNCIEKNDLRSKHTFIKTVDSFNIDQSMICCCVNIPGSLLRTQGRPGSHGTQSHQEHKGTTNDYNAPFCAITEGGLQLVRV